MGGRFALAAAAAAAAVAEDVALPSPPLTHPCMHSASLYSTVGFSCAAAATADADASALGTALDARRDILDGDGDDGDEGQG